MKALRLFACALSCMTVLSSASYADSIGLFSDATSGICAAEAAVGLPLNVYVIHFSPNGATGSAWRVDNSSAMVELGSSCNELSITGDPYTGISLGYGSCMSGTFVLCTLTFLKVTTGVIPGCYQLNVLPYPGEQTVTTVDCSQAAQAAAGGFFTFDWVENVTSGLNCWDCTTAAQSSTWGAVKALYR